MKISITQNGFTLIEVMITVSIVAILVALAIPSYTHFVRKANRGEAQEILLNWSNNQEIWRASHTTYADETTTLGVPVHERYTFTVSGVTSSAYTLTATTTGSQVGDRDGGASCDVLSLDQSNARSPASCW